jgi:2-(1,2-epoxy-1,2-dihydrophenyl)acetyl-CoA isomerase
VTTTHLLTSIDNGIARITFNRPEVRNALSPDMLEAMIAFLLQVEQDTSVRCVVLKGEGKHFMAGGDVKNFSLTATQSSAERRLAFESRVTKGSLVFTVLERLPQPVIASLRGMAAGAGVGFIAGADLVIAAESAGVVLAHINIGASPDGSTSYHLPRSIGVKRAKAMALLGDAIDAKTAQAYGLVNWVVPDDTLEAETDKLARRLAAGPAVALAQAKSLINQSLGNTLADQLAAEAKSMGISAASEDFIEGPKAFMEKRKAQFSGR